MVIKYLNADADEKRVKFKYVFQFDEDEIIYKYQKISELEGEMRTLPFNICHVFQTQTT